MSRKRHKNLISSAADGVRKLFKGSGRKRLKKRKRSFSRFETLEDRRMMTVALDLEYYGWHEPVGLGPFGIFGTTPGYFGPKADDIEGDPPAGQLVIQSDSTSDEITLTENAGMLRITGNIGWFEGYAVTPPRGEYEWSLEYDLEYISSIKFIGAGGDDRLYSYTSKPIIADGGSGNDVLWATGRGSRLFGGDGNDLLYLWTALGAGEAFGGNGNDTIHGSAFSDNLYGDEGNDTIYGYGDKDVVYGGAGADHLFGGDGDDRLFGEGGKDDLFGEGGNDYLDGGYLDAEWKATPTTLSNASDHLTGGSGSDTFVKWMTVITQVSVTLHHEQYLDYGPSEGDSILHQNGSKEFPHLKPLSTLSLALGTANGSVIRIGSSKDFAGALSVRPSNEPNLEFIYLASENPNGYEITGSSGNDTFILDSVPVGKTLRLSGGKGNDRFVFGGSNSDPSLNSLASINGQVFVNGGEGQDAIVLNDQGTRNRTIVTPEGTATEFHRPIFKITDQGIEREDTYSRGFLTNLSSTGMTAVATAKFSLSSDLESIEVYAGGSDDIFNATSTLRSLRVDAGDGNDRLVVDPKFATSGSRIVFNGQSGTDALDFAQFTTSVNITISEASAPGIFGYTGVDSFVLGQGNDSVDVGRSNAAYSALRGTMTFDGQGGNNTIVLHDEAASSSAGRYIVSSESVQIQSYTTGFLNQISYLNMQSLTLNASQGSDIIHLYGTAAGTTTTVNGNAGNDQFVFGNPASNMNDIKGTLTLNGRAGDVDYFTLNDMGESVGHTYRFSADKVTRDGMANVNFTNMYQFGLYAGTGKDVVSIDRTTNGAPIYITDMGGVDTLIAPNVSNRWVQSGNGSGQITIGSIYNSVIFSGMEQWQGGSMEDYYVLAKNQPLTGWIDGRGGRDTLDYSAWTSDLYVNLKTNSSSASTWGVWNVQDIVGGSGNDIFVGDGSGNMLDGGSGRDLLIGGRAAATLVGGRGEDILIGGTTSHDSDRDRLFAIRNAWTGSDTYANRVSQLQNGVGVPKLNASTVLKNGATNKITGASELDLFFATFGKDQLGDLAINESVTSL